MRVNYERTNKETTCRYEQALKAQRKAEKALEKKEKELAELNEQLVWLKRNGYQLIEKK